MARSQQARTFRLTSWLLSAVVGAALVALTAPPAQAIVVQSTSPVDGADGVPLSANVTVTFDVAATGVDASTFTLARGAVAVPAAVNGSGTSWTLDPTDDLQPGTTYTASLGATIGDANGRSQLPATSWSFTTVTPPVDDTPPTLTESRPDPGQADVDVRADVSATFSEAVLGVDETSFTLSSTGGRLVDAVVDRVGDTNRWILDPTARLAEDTRYTVGLLGGAGAIRDEAGNVLQDTGWSFTTAGEPEEPGDDTRRPRLVNESPRDGARRVSRFTDVRAHFSEAVFGVNTRTFRLVSARRSRPVPADVFRSRGSRRWVLDPDRRLARGTRYVAVLRGRGNGIEDAAGNNLFTTRWSFRTSR